MLGSSYMSLAWSSLAGTLVTVAVAWWFRPAFRWTLRDGLAGLPEAIAFSKHALSISVLGQAGRNAPEFIIGRAMDMASVAFFSRAGAPLEIFQRIVLRGVRPVCLPYLVRQGGRGGQGDLAGGYLRAIGFLAAFGWPFLMLMAAGAYSVIRLMYGPQWMASVPYVKILCAAGAIELVYTFASEALIAAGRVARANLLQFWTQVARVLGVLAVVPFGLAGASWGLLVAALVGAVCSQAMLQRDIGLRWQDVLRACAPAAAGGRAQWCTGPVVGHAVAGGRGHVPALCAGGGPAHAAGLAAGAALAAPAGVAGGERPGPTGPAPPHPPQSGGLRPPRARAAPPRPWQRRPPTPFGPHV